MQMQIATHIKVMAFDLRVIACMTSKHHDSPRYWTAMDIANSSKQIGKRQQQHMADDSPATCQSQPGLGP